MPLEALTRMTSPLLYNPVFNFYKVFFFREIHHFALVHQLFGAFCVIYSLPADSYKKVCSFFCRISSDSSMAFSALSARPIMSPNMATCLSPEVAARVSIADFIESSHAL